jgi:arsenite methyltransferase
LRPRGSPSVYRIEGRDGRGLDPGDMIMSTTTQTSSNATPSCCGPTCCGGSDAAKPADTVTAVVREKYGSTARSGLSSDNRAVHAVAEAFGYSAEELASIPAEANMGLSCGNPTATANLRPGEVVVDLGSGGGLDVFLAAQKVGPNGKAIGIDMTPDMIELARKNAEKAGAANAEFRLGTIDRIPLPDASADVVISNCVINLAPDKRAVFREIARILKPGGRLAVSDIALKKPLPPEVGNDLMAYVGCVAGAIEIDAYRQGLAEAGFDHVAVIDSGADLNVYSKIEGQGGCCSPAMAAALPVASGGCCGGVPAEEQSVHGGLSELLRRYDVNEFAASVKVYAVKAAR